MTNLDEETFAAIHRVFAEPKRLEIIQKIREKENESKVTCNCVLGEMEISQPTFSHHLAELSKVGLINVIKQGRHNLLSVNEELISAYLHSLTEKLKI